MKKYKKHILIVCLLLLLGILFLAVGTSAQSSRWKTPEPSAVSRPSASSGAGRNTGRTLEADAGSLHIGPIGSFAGIAHPGSPESDDSASNTDEGTDAGDGSGNTGISAGESGSFTPIVTGTITGSSGRGQETGSTVSSSPSSGTSSEAPVPAKPDPGSSSSQTPSSSGSSSSESSGSTENSGSGGIPSHHHHHHRTVAVTGVTLDKTSAYLEKPGGTVTLKATAAPEDTTQSKSVTWSSSDSTIAAVD